MSIGNGQSVNNGASTSERDIREPGWLRIMSPIQDND